MDGFVKFKTEVVSVPETTSVCQLSKNAD